MPRVFRKVYTRPVPPDAQRVTIRNKKGEAVPAVRFKDTDGRTVTAPLTRAGDRCRVASPTWYGRVNGAVVPLCTNKAAAELMLGERIRKAELSKAGCRDPFEEHRQRPLTEHLAEWEAALRAGGATPKHVRQTAACARRVIAGCGFVLIADLSASRVQKYLAGLRDCRRALPPLDPEKGEYTKRELAAPLGLKPSALPALVRRHRLPATGNGKRRRYPRATA